MILAGQTTFGPVTISSGFLSTRKRKNEAIAKVLDRTPEAINTKKLRLELDEEEDTKRIDYQRQGGAQ